MIARAHDGYCLVAEPMPAGSDKKLEGWEIGRRERQTAQAIEEGYTDGLQHLPYRYRPSNVNGKRIEEFPFIYDTAYDEGRLDREVRRIRNV